MSLLTEPVGTVTDVNGLIIEIWATELEGGGFTLTVKVVSGYADLRGFFLDGATATGSSLGALDTNLAKDVNMNGTGETFESAYEIGSAGMGKDDISEVTFTFGGSLADLDGLDFGIRATSTGADREGSVKLVGEFDIPKPPVVINNFPTMDHDLSNAVFYLKNATGDISKVKVEFNTGNLNDLDNADVGGMELTAWVLSQNVGSTLVGVTIHAGDGQNNGYLHGGEGPGVWLWQDADPLTADWYDLGMTTGQNSAPIGTGASTELITAGLTNDVLDNSYAITYQYESIIAG